MVDMHLSNNKLVARAEKMLMDRLDVTNKEATLLLEKYKNVRSAIQNYKNEQTAYRCRFAKKGVKIPGYCITSTFFEPLSNYAFISKPQNTIWLYCIWSGFTNWYMRCISVI